jgi:hypothetical protein
MSTYRDEEAERLHHRGIEAFREARWDEAVAALSALRAIDPSNAEVNRLLAEAQLKLEISRANMPDGTMPPRRRQLPRWIPLVAVALLLAGGGAAAFMFWPRPEPVVVQPTATPLPPTATALPTVTPLPPTATPLPTTAPTVVPTAEPTPVPQPGSLLVRMAEGQSLTRTTRNIEIILDASGSMLAELNGSVKIDIAHQALATLVQTLPDGTNVALRTYGQRRAQDCSDLELIQPLAPLDRAALIEQVNRIRPIPNARTPMAASIAAVTETLQRAQGDTLVVLVSDGDETCDGDPAAAAAALREQFPNVRVSVIGFNIEEQTWRERLQAIATSGAGGYFDAADAAQLETALKQAVALTYRVVDATGEEFFSGPIGSQTQLPAGDYRIEISDQTLLTLADVAIGPGLQTIVQLSTEGERMTAELIPTP